VISSYDWAGGHEAMWRFGPDAGPVVLAALPLFEEANRTRAFLMTLLRALAERGVASALPDLPGSGESLFPTETATLDRWRQAYDGAATLLAGEGRRVHGLGIRGGALVDSYALLHSRWFLSPQPGQAVVRELGRIWQAAEPGADTGDMLGDGPPIPIAGNLVSRTLLGELGGALPMLGPSTRVLRIEGDSQPADRWVPGSPLWRRVEPDNDPALAAVLADDIADWIASCAS